MDMNWEAVPKELYTNLGNTGLKISKIIVGCMSYGLKSWSDWVLEDEDKVFEILKKCYDSGIRTFDTADVYSNGHSEILLGKFLKKYEIPRDKVVILSKCFSPVDPISKGFSFGTMSQFPGHEYINSKGLSRKHIFDAAEASVKRLGTYMDVYQIHRFDQTTPIEETMEALHDIVKKGLTRYIGASSMKAYQFIMMQNVAEKRGWTKFISMQSYYNLMYRHDEEELNEYCNLTGVGLIPWSPNARGVLTRPVGGTSRRTETDKTFSRLNLDEISADDAEIVNRVEKVARDKGVSMAAVATAWVIHKGAAPIVGIGSPERVDDYIVAFKLKLSEEEIEFLEEAYVSKYIRI